jgi:hypothetical protein
VIRRPSVVARAPLAVAGFLSVPLFFASLMAASLARERPHAEHGVLAGTTTSVEGEIWALAVVPSLIVLAVGVLAMLTSFGTYISAAATIVVAVALTSRLDAWEARHVRRYPLGEDLIPGNDPSNHLDRGQWEHEAKAAALSLSHWTIALAIAAALIALGLALRRRRRPLPPPPPPPPELAEGRPTLPGS